MASQSHILPTLPQNTQQDAEPVIMDPSKYVTLPVQYEMIWKKYQASLDSFWTVYDVYIADDMTQFNTVLKPDEREYILKLLAFMYSVHYSVINKELFMQLMTQVDIKEASYYFGSQADAKKTHSMMYSILMDELLGQDTEKKEKLLSEVISMPQVREFIRWSILGTTSSTKSFSQRLLAFATIQGIIFPAPFVLINWLDKKNPSKIQGLQKSNRLIWRDEKLNLAFSCMLFEYIEDEISADDAHTIVREAVDHANKLFTDALDASSIGMDHDLMKQFIEYCGDCVLSDIKASKIFNKECPFDWVDMAETEAPTNQVQFHNVTMNSGDFGEAKFDVDEEF